MLLHVGFHEGLDLGAGDFLVLTLDGDGNGLAVLDTQTHQSHQAQDVGALTALDDADGALILLALAAQHAGGTGVDTNGILTGVVVRLDIAFLLFFIMRGGFRRFLHGFGGSLGHAHKDRILPQYYTLQLKQCQSNPHFL